VRAIVRLSLALLGACFAQIASAQSCPFFLSVTFADGPRECLTHYAISEVKPVGFSVPLRDLVPRSGQIAIAASAGTRSCPLVVAVGMNQGSLTPTGAMGPEYVAQRHDRAMQSCQSAIQKQGEACACSLLLLDGSTSMTRAEFEMRLGKRADPASQGQRPAIEPPSAPPVALPTAPVAPAAGAEALLSEMRMELEKLRSERAAASRPAAASQVARLAARALVIGNGQYASFGRLPNPANDARAIAQKLQGFGIPVDLVLDADRDQMIRALNEHARKAAGGDISILFYAGHGVQVEGTNYLIPINMSADGITAGYVKLAGISLNAALDYLPTRTRLVFLDACRDNPATRRLSTSRGSSGVGLAPVDAGSGTLIAFATKDGATADDGDGQHSPYTSALLRHLDAPQDISLVLREVRQTVLSLTRGRQEPWEYGSLVGGQIILPLLAR
jgi:hypothetical protein